MIKYTVEDLLAGKIQNGSLILVRWRDASDLKASLNEHVDGREVICKDLGVFLGITVREKQQLILGKDVVEYNNRWGATRIPLELIDEVVFVQPRDWVMKLYREVEALGRKVSLRKVNREEEKVSVVIY
jgi:hypothetical protein